MLLAVLPLISHAGIWHDLDGEAYAARGMAAESVYYRAMRADMPALRALLSQAPLERGLALNRGRELELPLPYGRMQRFLVEESPVMAPILAERYPEIRTYRVRGIDEPASTGRLDLTPKGFHAMLSTPAGTVYIDPDGAGAYRSYYKRDYASFRHVSHSPHVCLQHPEPEMSGALDSEPLPDLAQRALSGDQRRIYRLAVAATGEYTAYFGGRESLALAQIVTAINRVNQIYGRDLAIQFQLVGNNDRIIYSDPESDPYTHSPGDIPKMLIENQQNLDYVLGADNYDLGHLFGLAGGGLASVGSACMSFKAQAYTGTPEPDSDVFYIDFVAHELGHQLNASHSFNGTTANCGGINRDAVAAMEPGSGSTIMSYAGICGDENLQANSDATFHAISIQQMREFITMGDGSRCGSLEVTGNSAPIVDAGVTGADGVYVIPPGTPFRLTGQAGDVDGDTLSYQWDEMDAGGDGGATDATTIGTDIPDQPNPLFRSFLPKTTPERYFPRLGVLISGEFDIGETLPETSRELNFRLTVRDGESGVADDDLAITVDGGLESFEVTSGSLNNGGRFAGGSMQSVNWSVAGTESICPEVEISLLSLSEGDPPATYCDQQDPGLASLSLGRFPNNGSALVDLPDISLQRGRLMLACADGLFFDLSDVPLQIDGGMGVASDCKPLDGESLEHGTVFTDAGSAEKFDSPGGGGALWLLSLLLGVPAIFRWRKEFASVC